MRIMSRFVNCAAVAALASALWACSSSNSNAPPVNAAGQHPTNWLSAHQAAFRADQSMCTSCHGVDKKGGISGVSCFSPQFNGQFCHAQGPAGHPADWAHPANHGAAAKSQPGLTSGFANCQTCHGADFSGGVAGVSCFVGSTATGSCHLRNGSPVNAPHAARPWFTNPSPTHTSTVDDAAGGNAAVCALCHTAGNNLTSTTIPAPPPPYATGKPACFNGTLCHFSMGHPVNWAQPSVHGATAQANLKYCQGCHANNPTGGPGSNPRFNVNIPPGGAPPDGLINGCEDCHALRAAHPPVLQIPAAFGTISSSNPPNTPWYLHCKAAPSGFDACKLCHGAALDGVGNVAGATGCTFCHLARVPTTLTDCASCHANPPAGTTYPNIAGTHDVHTNGAQSVAFTCGDCHNGLGSVTLNHFSRSKLHTSSVQSGAVVFGAFASTESLTPTYTDATFTCANTYCHGNSLDKPATAVLSPSWRTRFLTGVASNDCAKCHGYPPDPAFRGHPGATPTQCIVCHPHVNAAGNGFTDKTLHINGVVDANAGSAPHPIPVGASFPGSAHKTVAISPFTACLGCHTNGSTIGVYPANPLGSAPDCRACHVKASPGNSCGSCHGSATYSYRPNGSTFPDINGAHTNSNHRNLTCATCHGSSAGTGQSTHGNSNSSLHNDDNVTTIIEVANPTGVIYSRSGNGDGRGSCNGTCNGHDHNPDPW